MPFLYKGNTILGHILSTKASDHYFQKHKPSRTCIPPKMPKQVCAFLGLVGYCRKFIKNFAKIAKPLTLLTYQQVKFDWTLIHHNALLTPKESIIQAPILQYPNPNKQYIVYTNASDDACRAQLSQEHGGTEFPIAFLSCTFLVTQRKWSITE